MSGRRIVAGVRRFSASISLAIVGAAITAHGQTAPAADPAPASAASKPAAAPAAPAAAPLGGAMPRLSPITSSVRITVVAHSSAGKMFCAMWRGEDGYPTKRKKAAYEGVDRKLRVNRALIVFNNVEPGEYAIACFHDENANNDLDTNFLGIPVEATGASNDARGFLGPPDYEDARFVVGRRQTKPVIFPVHYVF